MNLWRNILVMRFPSWVETQKLKNQATCKFFLRPNLKLQKWHKCRKASIAFVPSYYQEGSIVIHFITNCKNISVILCTKVMGVIIDEIFSHQI